MAARTRRVSKAAPASHRALQRETKTLEAKVRRLPRNQRKKLKGMEKGPGK